MNEAMKKYPPRPELTAEVRKEVITQWGECLDMVCNLWADKDDVIEAVIDCAERHDDGYALGKKIEECGIDVSFDLCEALDGVDSKLRRAHEQLIKDWVESNNTLPPFPVGARVCWRQNLEIKKGTIAEDDYNSKYGLFAIAEYGETRGWKCLVEFEDVELLEE